MVTMVVATLASGDTSSPSALQMEVAMALRKTRPESCTWPMAKGS
ncbi:hypothetical protein PF005_g33560 [Phytophthora fragariae]|uniref:Uncharacterized protein n=1 Tax=Phytophthora fragariae TaxID=53985 RepID=A0A6A3UE98_9STRA|nr:hypothetical protein PF010_g33159 [Phytophthora fragariae]KAE9148926.1 hypothetical protein PF005_g33560 [Phytophthora fragariae]